MAAWSSGPAEQLVAAACTLAGACNLLSTCATLAYTERAAASSQLLCDTVCLVLTCRSMLVLASSRMPGAIQDKQTRVDRVLSGLPWDQASLMDNIVAVFGGMNPADAPELARAAPPAQLLEWFSLCTAAISSRQGEGTLT